MKRLTIIILLFSLVSLSAQEDKNNILTAITKDTEGELLTLLERLDPEVNYIIKVGQFWCAPCRLGVSAMLAQKALLKEKYNTEVIILEQEYLSRPEELVRKKKAYNWDFPIYSLPSGYGFFGISGIPDYFFVKAGAVSPESLPSINCANLPLVLERELGWIEERFVFDKRFFQTITTDCMTGIESNLDSTDRVEFEDNDYTRLGSLFLREDVSSNTVIRYENERTNTYLDYNLDVCNSFRLVDFEGDYMVVQIEEIYTKGGRSYMVTDKVISNDCDQEVPFIIIEGIGTNGGLLFNIENDRVVSRLICHQNNNEVVYLDEDWGSSCGISALTSPDYQIEKIISLSPNPSANILYLDTQLKGEVSYEIIDVAGKRLTPISTFRNQTSIDISSLPSGIYQIIITQGKGLWNSTFVKR